MPIYDYACANCGHVIEVVHGVHESGPTVCPECGGLLRKRISAPAIHFRGSGWAKKDARDAGAARAGRSGKGHAHEGGAHKGEAGAESAKGEGAKSEGAKSDSAKSESAKSEPGKSESGTGASKGTE